MIGSHQNRWSYCQFQLLRSSWPGTPDGKVTARNLYLRNHWADWAKTFRDGFDDDNLSNNVVRFNSKRTFESSSWLNELCRFGEILHRTFEFHNFNVFYDSFREENNKFCKRKSLTPKKYNLRGTIQRRRRCSTKWNSSEAAGPFPANWIFLG